MLLRSNFDWFEDGWVESRLVQCGLCSAWGGLSGPALRVPLTTVSCAGRVPDDSFDAQVPAARDCFGRERFATDKDDRGGVGSFSADPESQRTLYVGGLPSLPGADMGALIRKHFGEWGKLSRVNLLKGKPVAFVRYDLRSSAEFAKVAM